MKRLPVLRGCDALLALEELHEILLVREAAHARDLQDGELPVEQQIFGDGDPRAVEVGQDRGTGIFFENRGEVGRVISEVLGDRGNRQRLVVVRPDPLDDIEHVGRNLRVQEPADLEGLVRDFEEQQAQGIVATPGDKVVLPLREVEQLRKQKVGALFQGQPAVLRNQIIFRGGGVEMSDFSGIKSLLRSRLPRL